MIGQEFRCISLVGCSTQFPRLTKRTGNFRPSSLYQKTAAKAWNRYQRMALKGFEEIEYEFPFGTFYPKKKKKKQECIFRCSVTLAKFPLKRQKKPSSFYFQTDFSEIFCGDPDSFASTHQNVKSLRYFLKKLMKYL